MSGIWKIYFTLNNLACTVALHIL